MAVDQRGCRQGPWLMAALVAVLASVAGAPCAGAASASGGDDLLTVSMEALKANPWYQAEEADFRAKRPLKQIAVGKLLPQLSAQAGVDRRHESVNGEYYGITHIDRSDNFNVTRYGVRLTQAVIRGDLFAGLDEADATVKQAGYQLAATRGKLLVEVAQAYFELLAANDKVSLSKAAVDALQEQLSQTRVRVASGLATDADAAAAQASQALAVANRLQAESQVELAKARLDMLTGQTHETIATLPATVTLVPPDPPDERAWMHLAEEQNPAVLAQRAAVEVAEAQNKRAARLMWPQLDVVGAAGRLDNGGGVSGDRKEEDERIGLQLSLPLFAGGQIRARMAQTEELKTRADALVEAARAKARLEARVAFLNTTSGLKRIDALKHSVDAAAASETAAQAGYDSGLRTGADLLTAIERRYQAEADYSAARYKYLVDSLRLRQAVGGLDAADVARVNSRLRIQAQ